MIASIACLNLLSTFYPVRQFD